MPFYIGSVGVGYAYSQRIVKKKELPGVLQRVAFGDSNGGEAVPCLCNSTGQSHLELTTSQAGQWLTWLGYLSEDLKIKISWGSH
jgi:hypothetical protein